MKGTVKWFNAKKLNIIYVPEVISPETNNTLKVPHNSRGVNAVSPSFLSNTKIVKPIYFKRILYTTGLSLSTNGA